MAAVLVLRLVFITMAVTSALGFVLRRRDWDDDADGDLAEALPVLRAERQRLEDDEGPMGANPYWAEEEMPSEEEDGLEMEPRLSLSDNRELLDTLLNEDNNEGYYTRDGYDDEEREEEEEEGPVLSRLDSDSVSDITESPADLKELESILEPSEDEKAEEEKEEKYSKENRSRRGSGKLSQKESEEKEVNQNSLDELLKTAERLEADALLSTLQPEIEDEDDEEDENNDITPIPVSDNELRAILEDEESDEEEEKGEEVLPPLSYTPEVPIKIKRSSRNFLQAAADDAAEVAAGEEAAAEVVEGQVAREYIRRFLELEDDENTNLANALNLATMAQVHQESDKLVVPEAKFIRKAIEDEQAIQELRAALSRDDPLPPPAVPAAASAAEAIGKREMEFDARELNRLEDQEEEENDEDEDFNEGVNNEDFNPYDPEDEEEEENMIQEIGYGAGQNDLALKLREYLEQAAALERENEVEEGLEEVADPLQRGAWLDRPIEMGQEGLTDQGEFMIFVFNNTCIYDSNDPPSCLCVYM